MNFETPFPISMGLAIIFMILATVFRDKLTSRMNPYCTLLAAIAALSGFTTSPNAYAEMSSSQAILFALGTFLFAWTRKLYIPLRRLFYLFAIISLGVAFLHNNDVHTDSVSNNLRLLNLQPSSGLAAVSEWEKVDH